MLTNVRIRCWKGSRTPPSGWGPGSRCTHNHLFFIFLNYFLYFFKVLVAVAFTTTFFYFLKFFLYFFRILVDATTFEKFKPRFINIQNLINGWTSSIRATCTTFLEHQNSKFESQLWTKNTKYTIYKQDFCRTNFPDKTRKLHLFQMCQHLLISSCQKARDVFTASASTGLSDLFKFATNTHKKCICKF